MNSDMSENVAYNNPAFPAYIKKAQLSLYPDFRAVSHWHDDLEFILILDGQMSYDVNCEHVSLQTGEGIFVNSRCFHYGYSDTHTECHFICILLSPSLLSSNEYFVCNFLNPLLQNVHFPYQKLTPASPWQNLILHELSALSEANFDKLRPFLIMQRYSHILDLLSENMCSFSHDIQNTDDIQSLTAMIGYVQKNYQNKLLIRDISSAGNCCKTKCTSLFQKYLSVSPMSYLNNYRLEKGNYLLRNTAMSITDIAYACGFSSTSYFCELFHKHYNITPGTYRKQNL